MNTCKRCGQRFAVPEEHRQLARQSLVFRMVSGGDDPIFEQLCPQCMSDLQPSASDIGSIDVKAMIAGLDAVDGSELVRILGDDTPGVTVAVSGSRNDTCVQISGKLGFVKTAIRVAWKEGCRFPDVRWGPL